MRGSLVRRRSRAIAATTAGRQRKVLVDRPHASSQGVYELLVSASPKASETLATRVGITRINLLIPPPVPEQK